MAFSFARTSPLEMDYAAALIPSAPAGASCCWLTLRRLAQLIESPWGWNIRSEKHLGTRASIRNCHLCASNLQPVLLSHLTALMQLNPSSRDMSKVRINPGYNGPCRRVLKHSALIACSAFVLRTKVGLIQCFIHIAYS